jgi:hypothetical protein
VAGDDAVARDDLRVHAEVAAAVRDELVDLLEGAGIEQQVDALARRQLALLVLLLRRRPRRRPAPRGAPFLRFDTGIAERADALHLTITRSPGTSGPTPDGVPVVMTSPGSSVQKRVTNSTSSGTAKINWFVFDDCRFSPFTQPSIARFDGSSPTAMHGPIGANVSKPFARLYCTSLTWRLARGHVIQARHAEHVVHRVGRLHLRGAAADHHGHLGLVVHASRPERQADGRVRADDGRRRLREHQRLAGQLLVHLRGVVLVVQARWP